MCPLGVTELSAERLFKVYVYSLKKQCLNVIYRLFRFIHVTSDFVASLSGRGPKLGCFRTHLQLFRCIYPSSGSIPRHYHHYIVIVCAVSQQFCVHAALMRKEYTLGFQFSDFVLIANSLCTRTNS